MAEWCDPSCELVKADVFEDFNVAEVFGRHCQYNAYVRLVQELLI